MQVSIFIFLFLSIIALLEMFPVISLCLRKERHMPTPKEEKTKQNQKKQLQIWRNMKSETRITASILKQVPNK